MELESTEPPRVARVTFALNLAWTREKMGQSDDDLVVDGDGISTILQDDQVSRREPGVSGTSLCKLDQIVVAIRPPRPSNRTSQPVPRVLAPKLLDVRARASAEHRVYETTSTRSTRYHDHTTGHLVRTLQHLELPSRYIDIPPLRPLSTLLSPSLQG